MVRLRISPGKPLIGHEDEERIVELTTKKQVKSHQKRGGSYRYAGYVIYRLGR